MSTAGGGNSPNEEQLIATYPSVHAVRPRPGGDRRHRSRPRRGHYPEWLIKMIVPSPPGGQTDVLARLLAQKIQGAVGRA